MKNTKTIKMVECALFAALIAIGAFIQIPVPFMDYFTLQFLFVILSGMILGSKYGLISVSVYVIIGLVGFPVFAAGGGITYILRPTFGYLLGFILASYTCGKVVEKRNDKSMKTYILSALSGFLVTYGIGLIYKYLMLNLYVGEPTGFLIVLASCFPLDMPGDFLLCLLGAGIGKKINYARKVEGKC